MHTLLQLVAAIDTRSLPHAPADQGSIDNILNILFAFMGSIALLMIVIGGFRYVLAHGDPSSVAKARNSIIYAVVGLIVTMTAYGIVNFVIKALF